MPYATHSYASTEYAGELGGSAAGAFPAGTEYAVSAEDREVVLRVQADAVVPYEDREVKLMPSVVIAPVMFVKNASAKKDYCFNWEEILESGETLISSTWDGGGLTASGDYILGEKTYVFLAGGANGTVYVVGNAVITSLGRTYVREFKVSIEAT